VTRPGHWPSQHGLLLLRAALLDGRAAERAWRTALATIDLDTLDPGSLRLLPLAQRNVMRLGLDDPWADRIRGVHRYWWANNQLLLRECGRAVTVLAGAGIPTLVLKGAAVGPTYYGDVGLRPMTDFDILVGRADVPGALGVLARAGWSPEKRVDDACLRLLHGVSLHDGAGRTLDLHWAIHEDDVRPDADAAAWRGAVPVEVAGAQTHMLAPASLLVHALSSGAKWAGDPAVRWVPDATLIIRRGDVDWDAFLVEARARRFVVRLRASLAYLAAALSVQVPPGVLAQLEAADAPLFERLEQQVRTRRHRVLGELPRYWFNWARSSPAPLRELADFPNYLRSAWDLPSARSVPLAAARRAMWRAATRSSIASRTTSQ
jgi:hypothetical protein